MSPQKKALSRKGSIRMERHTGGEQEAYDASKNLVKGMGCFMFLLAILCQTLQV